MSTTIFVIDYKCFDQAGKLLKEGTVKARHAFNGVEAQVKFEKHLKSVHPTFGKLEVSKCIEQDPINNLIDRMKNTDIFGKFKDIFG